MRPRSSTVKSSWCVSGDGVEVVDGRLVEEPTYLPSATQLESDSLFQGAHRYFVFVKWGRATASAPGVLLQEVPRLGGLPVAIGAFRQAYQSRTGGLDWDDAGESAAASGGARAGSDDVYAPCPPGDLAEPGCGGGASARATAADRPLPPPPLPRGRGAEPMVDEAPPPGREAGGGGGGPVIGGRGRRPKKTRPPVQRHKQAQSRRHAEQEQEEAAEEEEGGRAAEESPAASQPPQQRRTAGGAGAVKAARGSRVSSSSSSDGGSPAAAASASKARPPPRAAAAAAAAASPPAPPEPEDPLQSLSLGGWKSGPGADAPPPRLARGPVGAVLRALSDPARFAEAPLRALGLPPSLLQWPPATLRRLWDALAALQQLQQGAEEADGEQAQAVLQSLEALLPPPPPPPHGAEEGGPEQQQQSRSLSSLARRARVAAGLAAAAHLLQAVTRTRQQRSSSSLLVHPLDHLLASVRDGGARGKRSGERVSSSPAPSPSLSAPSRASGCQSRRAHGHPCAPPPPAAEWEQQQQQPCCSGRLPRPTSDGSSCGGGASPRCCTAPSLVGRGPLRRIPSCSGAAGGGPLGTSRR